MRNLIEVCDRTEHKISDQAILSAILALVSEMLERTFPVRRQYQLDVKGITLGKSSLEGMIEVKDEVADEHPGSTIGLVVCIKGSDDHYICLLKKKRKSPLLSQEFKDAWGIKTRYHPKEADSEKRTVEPAEKILSNEERRASKLLRKILGCVPYETCKWWALDEVFGVIFKRGRKVTKSDAEAKLKALVAGGYLKKTRNALGGEYCVSIRGKRMAEKGAIARATLVSHSAGAEKPLPVGIAVACDKELTELESQEVAAVASLASIREKITNLRSQREKIVKVVDLSIATEEGGKN